MYTRYYDGYARQPDRAYKEQSALPSESEPKAAPTTLESENEDISSSGEGISVASSPLRLPFGIDAEDLILIAVLLLVVAEASDDDFILPLILGYLLLGGR